MEELVEILKNLGLTLCTCESLTGGLFVNKMTEIAGVSAVLKGGVVTYWTEMKVQVVKVDQAVIDEFGVVSKECALAMAVNVKKLMDTDVAVSFTGNAGPDSLEGKPRGLVYSCICINDEQYVYEDMIDLPRNELRNEIVERMVRRLTERLKAID